MHVCSTFSRLPRYGLKEPGVQRTVSPAVCQFIRTGRCTHKFKGQKLQNVGVEELRDFRDYLDFNSSEARGI